MSSMLHKIRKSRSSTTCHQSLGQRTCNSTGERQQRLSPMSLRHRVHLPLQDAHPIALIQSLLWASVDGLRSVVRNFSVVESLEWNQRKICPDTGECLIQLTTVKRSLAPTRHATLQCTRRLANSIYVDSTLWLLGFRSKRLRRHC